MEGFSRSERIFRLLASLEPIDSARRQAWSQPILVKFFDFLDFQSESRSSEKFPEKMTQFEFIGFGSKKHLLIIGRTKLIAMT